MTLLIKLTTLVSILSSFSRTSHSSVIPAAVIRRHTVTYKDVPNTRPQIRHPVVFVPASRVNLFMQFKHKSNNLFVRQEHKGRPGSVQHSIFEEAPHILKHEVKKPVIQTVREVIIPYRQVIQEIKPVVEEVKTVVASKAPQSSAYMNFGDSVPNTHFGYAVAVNHESAQQYDSQNEKQVSPQYSSPESKPDSYDLSSIYGINPSVEQLTDYIPKHRPTTPQYDNQVYEQPMVYGLTSDIQHIPRQNKEYEYVVNTIHEKPVQYNDQNSYDDNKNYFYDQNENYAPAYNYREKPETNYIDQGYYSQANNVDNSDGYYSNDYQSLYNNEGYHNSGYSEGYSGGNSGDLATSDGRELQSQSPMISLYDMPIAKDATLASLAQLMSSLSYQYNYDNQSPALGYHNFGDRIVNQ